MNRSASSALSTCLVASRRQQVSRSSSISSGIWIGNASGVQQIVEERRRRLFETDAYRVEATVEVTPDHARIQEEGTSEGAQSGGKGNNDEPAHRLLP